MKHPIVTGVVALGSLASVGCAMLPASPTPAWAYGCSPQAPASYQLAQSSPMGTLEVRVLSSTGSPFAGREVAVSYSYRGSVRPTCGGGVTATTGADGIARFERLRIGAYSVQAVSSGSHTAIDTQVEADKATSVTLLLSE